MNTLYLIFGEGKDLSVFQMCSRSAVIFLVTLVLIRISGRRSFGVRTALDNIIVILLGSILSRAVVGASPFIPIVAASFVIVIFHRLLAFALVKSKVISNILEGKKILLYADGEFIKEDMDKALVCEEDIMQGVRKSALTEDMNKISKVYMERNGEISTLKKQ